MSLERKRPPWETKDPQIISAQLMRRRVGWLAILLPVVSAAGYCVFGQERGGFLGSISESYYTVMRDVFVGTLCAEAFFFFAYRGYNASEDRLFNVLGGLCVVIAFFSMNSEAVPATVDPPPPCRFAIAVDPNCTIVLNDRLAFFHREAFGRIHFGAAATLLAALGYVSICFFTKTDSAKPGRKKRQRNNIYRTCGVVIWAALALYGVLWAAGVLDSGATWIERHLLFFVEAVCLWAFGFSWLVKGDGVYGLADSPPAQDGSASQG